MGQGRGQGLVDGWARGLVGEWVGMCVGALVGCIYFLMCKWAGVRAGAGEGREGTRVEAVAGPCRVGAVARRGSLREVAGVAWKAT